MATQPQFQFANIPFKVNVSQITGPNKDQAVYTFSGEEAASLRTFFTNWEFKPSPLTGDTFTVSRADILNSQYAAANNWEVHQLLNDLKTVPDLGPLTSGLVAQSHRGKTSPTVVAGLV